MIATTDPQQEGYFKQLVNLDISDTGQSLKPRKGFLTTNVLKNTTLLNISDQSVIYADSKTQTHIIYDFKSNRGYLVDIDAGTLQEKLIPCVGEISNKNWNDVIDMLMTKYQAIQDVYDSLQGTLPTYDDEATYSIGDVVSYNSINYKFIVDHLPNVQMTVRDTGINLIDADQATDFTTNPTQGLKVYCMPVGELVTCVTTGTWNDATFENITSTQPAEPQVNDVWIDASAGDGGTGTVYKYVPTATPLEQGEVEAYNQPQYNGAYNYLRKYITVVPETIIPNAIDLYGVTRTLFKVYIEDDEIDEEAYTMEGRHFLMSMYYRENEVTIGTTVYSADTLEFEILDMDEHTTYDSSNRNIASKHSIIPDPMQILYTSLNRPDGHTSYIDQVYVKDSDDNYYINFAPDVWLEHTPHLALNPASHHLNDVNAKWAYRFDLISLVEDAPNFLGNWMKYEGPNVAPTPVFVKPTGANAFASEMKDRHYEGTNHIITLVPSKYDDIDEFSIADQYTEVGDWTEAQKDDIVTRYLYWRNILETTNKPTDKASLIEAIEELKSLYSSWEPKFFIEDTRALTVAAGISSSRAWYYSDLIFNQNGFSVPYTQEEYDTMFISCDELIELIETGTFDTLNFTWKYLPGGKFHNYVTGGSDHWRFHAVTHDDDGGAPDADGVVYFTSYDLFDNLYNKTPFYLTGNIIGFNDDTLTGADLPDWDANNFFKQGYTIQVYMYPYIPGDLDTITLDAKRVLKKTWALTVVGTSLYQSRTVQYGFDAFTNTTMVAYQQDDPNNIQETNNMMLFQDTLLFTWHSNLLYISEAGVFNDYKEINKFSFDSKIIKVLEFKSIVLVFTMQHLYAVFKNTLENSDGETTEILEFWATQKVLYNILTNEKYADVIQVFNEHILFYSEEGQMFLIKPSTMINDETRFSLKYLNQAANDILLNYHTYINERLANYNLDHTIEKSDVVIKALVSVNTVRIFYTVPGYITYILNYDVINNRFIVYDTVSFSTIVDKSHTENGEMYITKHNESLYFTFPYKEPNVMDANVDMSIVNNFKKLGISALVDTGNLNLNNHLRKRFRKLHTVFKNLSTSKLLYNVETMLDDIVSHPFYDTKLEVHDVGGISYYVTVPKLDNNDLIDLIGDNQISDAGSAAFKYAMDSNTYEEDSLLMDFAEFTSSKLLTHKALIQGMGKVLRIKMQYISKGDYKIQSFGIVYKERRI